ncbi:ABC transporter G family member 23-like [Folsomia candida]|uniref:ABC transporter G family member 23-like n=1 Tax=Folsomia candida TaxID=158441 RepID=UPI001604FA28|nr:ABC transporter G family member 23-like [Folsomia candida]
MTLNDAVNISSAYKSYQDGFPVLSGLSMHVEKSIIYGLLGASGCGKTTLLNCILGLTRLDSGHISVMGRNPDTKSVNIGHMPQDVALYPLKISEIFQYFGKLLGLTDPEILTRSKELKVVVDLSDLNQYVSTLSGGQRRRVSLAVGLINQPKLLILDEPTVGIDPLLRESIWDYLSSLAATLGTTIIVTTHYTEEARRFNKIHLNDTIATLDAGGCYILHNWKTSSWTNFSRVKPRRKLSPWSSV